MEIVRKWFMMEDGTYLRAWSAHPDPRYDLRMGAVLVHGFAGYNEESGGLFLDMASLLVAHGYHVLAYNQRGCGTDREKSSGLYGDCDLEIHRDDYIQISNMFLRNCCLRQRRLASIGFSLGATIVLMASNIGFHPRWLALISPALNPKKDMWDARYEEMARNIVSSGRSVQMLRKSGAQLGLRILYSLRDTNLGDACLTGRSYPIAVIHGSQDKRIDISTTRKAVAHARERSCDVMYREQKGASHSFHEHRLDLLTFMTVFLSVRVARALSLTQPLE